MASFQSVLLKIKINKIFIMKKIIAFSIIFATALGTHAQVTNTKWKTTLQLDNPLDVIFSFGQDTLVVVNTQDNSTLETMKYSTVGSVLTIQKLSGMSVCDSSLVCKYKFGIEGDEMTLAVIDDACNDRAQVLNNMKLNREKQ
jgi:hypothetical protein